MKTSDSLKDTCNDVLYVPEMINGFILQTKVTKRGCKAEFQADEDMITYKIYYVSSQAKGCMNHNAECEDQI